MTGLMCWSIWELVPYLYLFGEQPRLDSIPDWLTHTVDWEAASAQVLASLRREQR